MSIRVVSKKKEMSAFERLATLALALAKFSQIYLSDVRHAIVLGLGLGKTAAY